MFQVIKIVRSPGRVSLIRGLHRRSALDARAHTFFGRNRFRAGVGIGLLLAVCLTLLSVVPGRRADVGGLPIPEAWSGTWEVTVSYRDRQTGALVATDVTTTAMCPLEPIAPPLLNTSLRFSGLINDNQINISGKAKFSPRNGCNVFIDVTLESNRDGDAWSGTGSWAARTVGNCEHISFGEDFVVSGRRVSTETTCDGKRLSLLERFFAHAALVPLFPRRDFHD